MSKPETAKTAHGTRGGATPGEVGALLVYEIEKTLGAAPGVVIFRNAVMGATLKSGREVLTGLGGKGAPDLYLEVRGADGEYRAVWMEAKAGEGELNPDQVKWHAAAKLMKRHVFKVKSVEEAVAIVARFQAVPERGAVSVATERARAQYVESLKDAVRVSQERGDR